MMEIESKDWNQAFCFDDMAIGAELPELTKRPTPTMLFRFSAVTWNAHRIHYDQAYAATEAHPGVLVQATMHGAFLIEMLTSFAGVQGKLVKVGYSNRARAIAGDTLISGGQVTSIDSEHQHIHCAISERNQDGVVCARGEAVIFLPRRR